MTEPSNTFASPTSVTALRAISSRTLSHYEERAEAFWEGTRDHDVSQNLQALLGALPARSGLRILDLGCGPGRDLMALRSRETP